MDPGTQPAAAGTRRNKRRKTNGAATTSSRREEFWLAELLKDVTEEMEDRVAAVRISWLERHGSGTHYRYAYDDEVDVRAIMCFVNLEELGKDKFRLTAKSLTRVERSLLRTKGALDEDDDETRDEQPQKSKRLSAKVTTPLKKTATSSTPSCASDDQTGFDRTVQVVRGDIGNILEINCRLIEGIAFPTNGSLHNPHASSAGVIFRRAGHGLDSHVHELTKDRRVDVGEVAVTPGFDAKVRRLIHCVGPRVSHSSCLEMLERTYKNMLEAVVREDLSCVAITSISTGTHGVPVDAAAAVAMRTIQRFLRRTQWQGTLGFVERTLRRIKGELEEDSSDDEEDDEDSEDNDERPQKSKRSSASTPITPLKHAKNSSTPSCFHEDCARFNRTVHVVRGDIGSARVINFQLIDGIAFSTAGSLHNPHTGSAGVVFQRAGPALESHVRELTKDRWMDVGGVAVTPGYNSGVRRLIHSSHSSCLEMLQRTYENLLEAVVRENLSCVAITSLSTGIRGVPEDAAAMVAMRTIQRFLRRTQWQGTIGFVCFQDTVFNAFMGQKNEVVNAYEKSLDAPLPPVYAPSVPMGGIVHWSYRTDSDDGEDNEQLQTSTQPSERDETSLTKALRMPSATPSCIDEHTHFERTVHVVRGSIGTIHEINSRVVDGIAFPAHGALRNPYFGAAGVVFQRAGPELDSHVLELTKDGSLAQCAQRQPSLRPLSQKKKKKKKDGSVDVGEVAVTPGFKAGVQRLIHCVGPPASHPSCLEKLELTYEKLLAAAVRENLSCIAITSISTGIHGMPMDVAAMVAMRTIQRFLRRTQWQGTLAFVCQKEKVYDTFAAHKNDVVNAYNKTLNAALPQLHPAFSAPGGFQPFGGFIHWGYRT
ncbi:TPA: hypothetical protein N0F65_007442 [Lagenidium giganteum]|uniref:Macro domain-containing protein n=1 Tax=Lagenidium giganteum TaxID=4803 RepID=A0AAV2ZIE9_9STRA|nr:TPA: hypothetical protein N0F65_007442 [Lagenidium giganteum]